MEKLFSSDGDITSLLVLCTTIGVEVLFVLFGVILFLSDNSRTGDIGLSFLSVVIVIVISIATDGFYGEFLMPATDNLLFPAFSRAQHNTSEFNLDVRINNLGFRGSNTTVKKARKRVVIIGDSFTFGWGVEEDATWIHLLSKKYPEVEFLNLGQGGNHPGDYVRIAKNAIPLLKPDLLMVAILQGNDLHQLMRVIV
ncbi:MAG: hypothetical protein QF371_00220, partial [Flavobacteriales bacterium]|nr:hypothetical protein [Flavobacteriales bacterium]